MKNATIKAALLKYSQLFNMHPARFPLETFVPEQPQKGTSYRTLQHVKWMIIETTKLCDESESFAPDDMETHNYLREKAMRWLCFVQGVLWTLGFATIEELRHDNSGLTAAETPTRET